MNKGYAFGFLIVLLVLILGMYVAYTGFVSSREALRALPTSPPATKVGEVGPPQASPAPTFLPTLAFGVSPTLQISETIVIVTPTASVEAPPVTEPATPVPAEPSTSVPTEPSPSPPTSTPVPQAPPPTPVPVPAYQFRLAGPPSPDAGYGNCCYLFGTVRDSAGNGLEGVRVQALNEWNTLPPAATKGGGELGQYNISIGRDVVAWDVVVLDAAGNQISTKVQIQFDPDVANAVRINWQRSY